MAEPGKRNAITDVEGLTVGNATDEKAQTGVTVLRCAAPFAAAADIRGGGPGTREISALSPENLVGKADAIVLSGGSVFGLAAADGVCAALSYQNEGLRLGDKGPAIPIVPAAILHDLNNDGDKNWGETPPYHRLGAEALTGASRDFSLGSVGAGRGAMAGAVKGGLGSASLVLDSGICVGALAAANPAGSVLMEDGQSFYAWPLELGAEYGGRPVPQEREGSHPFPKYSRLAGAQNSATPGRENTTLAIVATSADLTRVEAKRVAIMAHDGMARAIRPVHTPFDGDIVIALATGAHRLPASAEIMRAAAVAEIGAAAGDCLARAIARGVFEASSRPA
ncbi:MAG: P1 family peptidase [Pseudomonadota bacterium]